MKFNCIFLSAVSACFEWESPTPYFSAKSYAVLVNGKLYARAQTNVFSLYDLQPDTVYTVEAEGYQLTVTTKPQTAAISARSFGAKGDGVTDDTVAIQRAIDACPDGGCVTFDEGVYKIRPILLRSERTLYLKKGAELLGDNKETNYPVLPAMRGKKIFSTWEGEAHVCYQSLLFGYRLKNVCVVGEGCINGNAGVCTWWNTPKGRAVARPRLVFFNDCKNIFMHGVTCKNSPSWTVHPYRCQNLGFYGLYVSNPYHSPNTDGLNPESCKNVQIIGCVFSVGDDCVAIKSGKRGNDTDFPPAERHLLRNNLFERGHGAVVLGSEISGGVKDLTVCKCVFKNTDRGLRIKTRRGRGKRAVVDGVTFDNIRMEGVKVPVVINAFYFCDEDGKTDYVQSHLSLPVDGRTPYLGAFTFRNMVCVDCSCMAAYIDGLPERPIKSVTFQNVFFCFDERAMSYAPAMQRDAQNFCRAGVFARCAQTVTLQNVTFQGLLGDPVMPKNCGTITVEGE